MRTAFWARAAVLAALAAGAGHACDVAASMGSGTRQHSANSAEPPIEVRASNGARYVFAVTRDATVSRKARAKVVDIVGEIDASAIILIDTYPSIPGGMSYCQAGEERFLRVFTIAKKPRETFRLKLESCRDNLELASPGIEWSPESSTLKIHWLQGPGQKGTPEDRVFRIARDGKVE